MRTLAAIVSCLLLGLVVLQVSAVPTDPPLLSVCPALDPEICKIVRPGKPQCHNDGNCTNNMKCCCSNCGLRCVTPERVKPGHCPNILAKCNATLVDSCKSDSNCQGKQKCCKFCGMKCRDPIPDPEGFCPVNDAEEVQDYPCPSSKCSRDSDCGPHEKCCSSKDGQTCVKPITVKPGRCPSIRPLCLPLHANTCVSDGECPGKLKCCNICGKPCSEPQQVPKIGSCPPFLPKGAVSHIVCTKLNTTECTYDSDCEGTKKCCSQFCSNVCRDPVIEEKAGMCPPPLAFGVALFKCPPVNTSICSQDSECTGKQKCCEKLCRKYCADPITAKPGCCPNVRMSCPRLPSGGSFKDLCQNDFNCTGDLKCCNRCGKQCTAPDNTVRDGSCPANIYMCPIQTGPPTNQCDCDNQCPPNKKCCFRCGGKMCVDPKVETTD